jgi:3-hydroxyacyl-[acyl-carrier-protein] dehydratase
LEAATQASAWLLRLSEDYSHSILRLQEAKNVRYADFVPPGSTLVVHTSLLKQDPRLASFRVTGQVDNRVSLSGRLVIERLNLRETDPSKAQLDKQIVSYLRSAERVLLRAGANI